MQLRLQSSELSRAGQALVKWTKLCEERSQLISHNRHIDLAAGNLFSIYSPNRIEAGVFGRQRASLTTVLASFVIRGALFGVGAVVLWLSRHYAGSWIIILIFSLLVGLAFTSYVFVLDYIDGIALRQRENLISQLSR